MQRSGSGPVAANNGMTPGYLDVFAVATGRRCHAVERSVQDDLWLPVPAGIDRLGAWMIAARRIFHLCRRMLRD